jgi:hypothetical protein
MTNEVQTNEGADELTNKQSHTYKLLVNTICSCVCVCVWGCVCVCLKQTKRTPTNAALVLSLDSLCLYRLYLSVE